MTRYDAEAIATLTADLVRARSENPGGTEAAAALRLADELRALGARIELDEFAPGRPNLLARLGPSDARGGILFLGHSDVVPAGEGWSGDPFVPRRDGDALIGRGTADMKGGLAAVVAAMAEVHAERPDLPLTLLCTGDEEADALGVRHHLAAAAPEPYDACIVAEPTGMVTIIGCRGAANLRIDISGASAHAGRPADGASAILAAADVIAVVEADAERLAGAPHPVLGAATWNVGRIEGGHGTSIVPDRCTLRLDRRLLPGEDSQRILDELLDAARARVARLARPGADRIRITGAVEMTMPGFCADPDLPLARIAADAVRAVGYEGATDVWTASCEGGFIADHHGVPTIVLGPGDLTGQAHQPDERVSIAELHACAAVYARVIRELDDELRRSRRSPEPTTMSAATADHRKESQ